MSPLIPPAAGPIGAVLIARKRRKILRAFREAGATSPATARGVDEVGLSRGPLLAIQRLRGLLVEVEPGRFYLDEARAAEVARWRRLLALSIAGLAVVVALILWYLDAG